MTLGSFKRFNALCMFGATIFVTASLKAERPIDADSPKAKLDESFSAIESVTPSRAGLGDGQITFTLRRNDRTVEAWKTLLRGWVFRRPVGVALGTENGIDASIAKLPESFELVAVPRDWKLFVSIALALCVVAAIIALGALTNLLKDSSLQQNNAPAIHEWKNAS